MANSTSAAASVSGDRLEATSLLPVSAVTIALWTVTAYGVWRFLIYPLYLSPLAQMPNAHWSSAVSPIWILVQRFNKTENEALLKAHGARGPVLRLGPGDVSIDNVDHVKTVYGGGFDRTEWYSMFNNYGVPCMFSAVSGREHALRKRMLSHVYSKSFIQSSPAVAAQARTILLGRLLPVLTASTVAGQALPSGIIDVVPLFLATSMDLIAAHVFGLHCGTNFIENRDYRDHWIRLYLDRHGASFFLQEIPGVTRFASRLGVRLYPRRVDRATDELAAWNAALCEATAAFLAEKAVDDSVMARDHQGTKTRDRFAAHPEDEPLVMRALVAAFGREAESNGTRSILYEMALRDVDTAVQSELFDHILAGQDTTGMTLAAVAWRLSLDQAAQDALRDELLRLQTRVGDSDKTLFFPDAKTLDALPVLHAVIMETLRRYGPIESPLPRQTPPNGCRIGPYAVPGGVRIAAAGYTLHRHERIFSDPDKWDYRRWMQADGTGVESGNETEFRARARQFWAFGSGGRMCVGSNFAMQGMKAAIAMIYSRFKTCMADNEPDRVQGEPLNTHQLFLRFEPLATECQFLGTSGA